MVRGTLAPGDGPTSGSSGKMLSTSLLYLGRRAPQQPHTPGTGTRMPCELSLPGPGWVASEKPNPGWKQKGPSVRAPGPQSFLLFPHPTPTLRHCLSCLVSFAWGSGISRCQQIRICSGSKAIEHTCACTRTHTHTLTHCGPRPYKTASCSPRLFPRSWEIIQLGRAVTPPTRPLLLSAHFSTLILNLLYHPLSWGHFYYRMLCETMIN